MTASSGRIKSSNIELNLRFLKDCDVCAIRSLAQASSGGVLSLHLKQLDNCWTDHCDQMLLIRSIFLYLDRTYVVPKCSVRSLWDMGLLLFRENLQVGRLLFPDSKYVFIPVCLIFLSLNINK